MLERTQQRVSASTLRRFWGYVNEGGTASKFTKNVLAIFLGYADFEEFVLLQGAGEQQSQMVMGKEISCDDLYEVSGKRKFQGSIIRKYQIVER